MPSFKLSSEQVEAIFQATRLSVGRQIEVQSEHTQVEKLAPFVNEMVCTAADLLVDTAKSDGDISPTSVGVFLVNRAAGMAGLSENEKTLCVAALASLATTTATSVPVLAGGVASEAATAGAASPVSVPLLLTASASLALAGWKANQQCGPLVAKAFSQMNDELFQIYLQFNVSVGNPTP